MRNGYGRMIYSNGDMFEGTFKDNQPQVKGKYINAETGAIYEGGFKDG